MVQAEGVELITMLTARKLISVLLLVSALRAQSPSDESRSGRWRIAGQNLNNTWSQPAEHSISPTDVHELKPKWVFTTGGNVSAIATVDGDAAWYPPILAAWEETGVFQ